MKKVLIISHAMEIGGAERALLGLLDSFDYQNYSVDLFLLRQEGELTSLINKQVNLLPMNRSKYLAVPMKILIKDLQFRMLYGRLKAKILSRYWINKLNLKAENQVELAYSHKYTYKYTQKINPNIEYDLAISFLTPHYICRNKVNAKKYLAWIHTDYSTIDIDVKTELEMWSKYDYIASISDKCTESFLGRFPTLKKKIIRIDNIVTSKSIYKQAEAFGVEQEMPSSETKLLSVGRFSYQKNFENIPEICRYIINEGLKIKWYLIGYGGDEVLIRQKIKELHMEDYVIILGKKDNPYPYIKKCDIYIQPSRYEGKAVTVREAQILNKPVIITDFPTSNSQLNDGVDGLIVPIANESCAKGIVNVINNKSLQDRLIKNTKIINYSNESEINKIYELVREKL